MQCSLLVAFDDGAFRIILHFDAFFPRRVNVLRVYVAEFRHVAVDELALYIEALRWRRGVEAWTWEVADDITSRLIKRGQRKSSLAS